MSLINLVGNLLTPSYDALYLVYFPVLREAVEHYGAKIDGVVGSLVMKKEKAVKVQLEDMTEANLRDGRI